MKRTLLLVAFSLLMLRPRNVAAEEVKPLEPGPWNFDTTVGVNLSQSAFSNNWAGGDRGSFVWVLNSDLSAERQFSKSFNLKNELQLAFGQTAKQSADPNRPDRNRWESPEKSTDLIVEESVGRFTLGAFVDPYLSFRLDSQFLDQSDLAGTIPFNPVKLTESGGIARVFEKTEKSELISRLGMGFRQTFRRTFIALGPEKESFSTNDGGFEWQTTAVKPLSKERILYKGKLLVFAPVFFSESDRLDAFDAAALAFDPNRESVTDFWRVPDVNFQNTFTAQITKLLSVSLYVQAVYDKYDAATLIDDAAPIEDQISRVDAGIRKGAQFKENLSIGITYQVF